MEQDDTPPIAAVFEVVFDQKVGERSYQTIHELSLTGTQLQHLMEAQLPWYRPRWRRIQVSPFWPTQCQRGSSLLRPWSLRWRKRVCTRGIR